MGFRCTTAVLAPALALCVSTVAVAQEGAPGTGTDDGPPAEAQPAPPEGAAPPVPSEDEPVAEPEAPGTDAEDGAAGADALPEAQEPPPVEGAVEGAAAGADAEATPQPPPPAEEGAAVGAEAAAQPAPSVESAAPVPQAAAAADTAETAAAVEPVDAAVAGDSADVAPAFEPNWRGSGLGWTHSVAYGTFDRSLQPSYNPTYSWAFDLVLRWNFRRDLNARVIQSANVELTDSEFTTEGQQLLLSDTRLRTDYRVGTLALTEGQNLSLMARGTLLVPLSKSSRAATMTTATLGRGTLIWSFDEPLGGLSLIGAWSFRKNWNRETTVQIDEPFPCAIGSTSPGSVDCRNGTLANVDWGSTALGLANLQINAELSAALAYAHTWNRTYNLPAATVEPLTGPKTIGEAEDFRFRNTQIIDLTVSYMPSPWWTASLSLTNQFFERGPNGELRGPFDPQDLFLGVSVFVTPPPPSSGQKQNLLDPLNQ